MKFFIFIFVMCLLSCNKYSQGENIYTQLCSNCHMDDGSGLKSLIPSINLTSMYQNENLTNLICKIHTGINADSLGTHLKYMPDHKKMTDAEMTNLVNYLRTYFGKNPEEVTLLQLKSSRQNCK